MKRIVAMLMVALFIVAVMAVTASTAFAVGGPNAAGNSGHFKVKSAPCSGPNNHPHCPGPH